MIAIFTNFSGKTAENIGSCQTKGGECATKYNSVSKKNECEQGEIPLFVSGDCDKKNQNNLCCIKAT